ncbi:MAG TPA: hypothetical protein GX401_06375 [Clostridiales bacterium]|nr:hypothetical protein [Clostridiales bacterium]
MECCKKFKLDCCDFLGIFISIVTGVLMGVYFTPYLMPFIGTGLFISILIGVVALLIVAIGAFAASSEDYTPLVKSLCKNGKILLIAIVGTLLTATIGLTIFLFAFEIFSSILIGLWAFFFILTLIYMVKFLFYIIKKICC